MSDILHYQGDSREGKNPVVKEVINSLGEMGSKNYNSYVTKLSGIDLTPEEKDSLIKALFFDLEKRIQLGNFEDIGYARGFLDFLGVKDFSFSEETIAKITELYNKYSYEFLLEMSPALIMEKIGDKWEQRTRNGQIYDRTEYVRNMMQKENMQDISTEAIEELWKYREFLIALHNNHWDPKQQVRLETKLLSS